MKTLTDSQVRALIDAWRAETFSRFDRLRREVESGAHSHTLETLREHCDALGSVNADLLQRMTVPPASLPHEEPSYVPSARERTAALAEAATMLTCETDPDPISEAVRVLPPHEWDTLDPSSQFAVARHYLQTAIRNYEEQQSRCYSLTDLNASAPPKAEAPSQSGQIAEQTMSVTLSDAWELYVQRRVREHKSRAWTEKGIPEKAQLGWVDLAGLIGADRPVATLSMDEIDRYERFANSRPKRLAGAYKGMTARELEGLAETDRIPLLDRRAPGTVATELSYINEFLEFCRMRHGAPLPAELKLSASARASSGIAGDEEDGGVDAWSDGELLQLLDPAVLGPYVDKRGAAARGEHSEHRWTYFPWALVLAAYTGARRNEILGLAVGDLIEAHPETTRHGEVPVIYIRRNQFRALKTSQAERCIPIHPDLERLGLWELVKRRRGSDNERLLWEPLKGGDIGISLTQDFMQYTKALGLHVPRRKVLHSFRHSFKTKARGHFHNDGLLNGLLGHAENDSTGGSYIHGLKVPQHEHMGRLKEMTFGFDLDGLRALLARCMP